MINVLDITATPLDISSILHVVAYEELTLASHVSTRPTACYCINPFLRLVVSVVSLSRI